MEKNNSKTLIWVGVVVVVIIVALAFVLRNNNTNTPVANNPTATEPQSAQDISAKDIGAGAISIAYADALVKYADRRIQLDPLCHVYPNTVTYKDNTGIMIDNRSGVTRTVKVGTTFTIKPYGFKIVVLPDVYLKSKTILIDCDKNQNVATVLIQE